MRNNKLSVAIQKNNLMLECKEKMVEKQAQDLVNRIHKSNNNSPNNNNSINNNKYKVKIQDIINNNIQVEDDFYFYKYLIINKDAI